MVCSPSRFWLSTLAVSLACSAIGGGLGDLKKKTDAKAEKKSPQEPKIDPAPSSSYSDTTPFGTGTYPSYDTDGGGSSLLGGFWGWLVAGPFQYRADDPSASMSSDQEDWAEDHSEGLSLPKHEAGQSVMPFVRADLNWQHIDGDNKAIDGRVELGYKAIAFMARSTKYDDRLADLTQRINQYYGIMRYGGRWPGVFPGSFEVGLGLGAAHHKGDLSDDSSFAITIPLKYHPTDWLGVEFRPAWYEGDYGGIVYDIGDYDLSASLGYR